MKKLKYILIAGVNGAGKSTLYQVNPKLFEDTLRVNADEILRKNQGDWQNPKDNIFAGRETVKQIQENFKNRISFHQETTLASNLNGFKKNIQKAREKGYEVQLLYVSLDSPQRAIERVNQRVLKGGHGIPNDVIIKRYFKSLENLKEVSNLVDKFYLYENNNGFNRIENDRQFNLDKWLNNHTALSKKGEILMALVEQQEREYLKQNILEMQADDPTMMYGEPEEIIYEIDDIKVYGGFEYGIRGVDHNVLIDDKITWEKLLEYGTVIVPETKSYISNTNIKHYDDMDYNRLSLDNNHIMGFKKETDNDEQEHELNFIKRTGISENNQKFYEDYHQPLFAKKVVIEDKNDYQKVYVEAVNNQQEKQYLNIVTAEITAEKLQTFEKGLTGEEWLAEDIKSDVIAKDSEKSFTFPKEKISNSNFQPIEKVAGDLREKENEVNRSPKI